MRTTDWSPQVDMKRTMARDNACLCSRADYKLQAQARLEAFPQTSTFPSSAFSSTDFAPAGFLRRARELCGPCVTSLPCNLLAEVREIFLCCKLVLPYISASLQSNVCRASAQLFPSPVKFDVQVQGHTSLTVTKAHHQALTGLTGPPGVLA